MIDGSTTIIVDLGSYNIKAGLLTDADPRFIVPSAYPSGTHNFPIDKKIPVNCSPDFVISQGEVTNEDRMNYIFASIFDHIFPSDQPEPCELHFVLNYPPYPTRKHMSYIGQLSFELMEADSIILRPSVYFSQIQFSLPNCICIDIGHDITQVLAIEDYNIFSPSIYKSVCAGSSLDLFTSIDRFNVYKYETWGQTEQARKKKEDLAFSSLNFENELNKNDDYFPIVCGELLFNKKLFEAMVPEGKKPDKSVSTLMDEPSVAEIIKNSIEKCHESKRKLLWNNIIVSGGTSLMKGFRERLKKDLHEIAPSYGRPRLFFPDDAILNSWQGSKWMNQSIEDWLEISDYKEDHEVVFNRYVNY